MSGGAHVAPRAAFGHRDFRRYQAARFLSVIGTQMQSVAVGWQIYELTHRPLDLGYVGLAQFAPAFGLSLVTGHAADRFDRRRILVGCNAAVAVCALLLMLLSRAPGAGVLPIYGVLVLLGIARAFSGPAGAALMPSLVPPEHFSSAVAWSSSIWQVATIVGPALGGALYGLAQHATAVYGCTAALLAIAAVLVATLHPRAVEIEKKGTSWETLLAGIRYVWKERVILASVSLDLFAVLLGGAVALLPVFASDILHVGPWGLGILRSGPAVGAAVMAIGMAYRPLRKRSGATMLSCVALFALATIAFGLSRNVILSFLALVVVGASDMVSVVVRQTLVQLNTPPQMRGRVSAVNMMFVVASNELGEFESGITAAWLGVVPAVVIGGVGSLLVVGLYALFFPELRRIDRLDAPRTPQEG
jgi:MFS family permease